MGGGGGERMISVRQIDLQNILHGENGQKKTPIGCQKKSRKPDGRKSLQFQNFKSNTFH